MLVFFQRLNLLSFPVEKCEYKGKMPKGFLKRYPNALANLVINQLEKLEKYNQKRVKIALEYSKVHSLKRLSLSKTVFNREAIYLRYPMQIDSRNILVKIARKKGILLGNWYHNVIDPFGCQLSVVGYQYGSCPKAEFIAQHIINLPTYPRMTNADVQRVISSLNYDLLH